MRVPPCINEFCLAIISVSCYLVHKLLCTIVSKINDTPKGVYLHISKIDLYFRRSKFTCQVAHNNISQICYCNLISLQSAAVNCCYSDAYGGNIYFAGSGTLQGCTVSYVT